MIAVLLGIFPDGIKAEKGASENTPTQEIITVQPADNFIQKLYLQFENAGFSYIAFETALKGYAKAASAQKINKKNLLTLIDFSLPSSKERCFVLDLSQAKVLYKSLVAHGKNTGELMATQFSNNAESYQSSLGFYLTAETYLGKHGNSLRLDGLEKGINDNARDRGIVMHAADYVSKEFIAQHGRLGRSQGCPALPSGINDKVINSIKGGSLLFIYAENTPYLKSSAYLKGEDFLCLPETLAQL